MKKTLLLALGLMMTFSTQAAKIYSAYKDGTVTYYYDDFYMSRESTLGCTVEDFLPNHHWSDYHRSIYHIVIDPSMKDAPLTDMRCMFCAIKQGRTLGLTNLVDVTGLENLNTSQVTDMSYMFYGAYDLVTISGLETLNTSNVTKMTAMFKECKGLKTLDLRSFDVSNVTDMGGMFYNCQNLVTIYCDEDWSKYASSISSTNMFYYCKNLIGGLGTSFSSENPTDITYARMDRGTSAPGYFTGSIYHSENGWLYYDDGVRINNFGNGSGLQWGIMYPANSMNYTTLYKVAFYEHMTYNTDPTTIIIRTGGASPDKATTVHTETIQPEGKTGWHVVRLSTPVNFDNSQNLWITLSSDGQYPAMICADAGDPNSRWVSLDGTKWYDLAKTQSQGVYNEYSFMVRACFVDENQGVEEVLSDQVRSDKVLRDGQLFILRGDKTYTITGQEIK